eukprot:scaffold7381_cov310-Pinguiococcus_pyrenoidosus.AAC.4
MQRSNLLRGCGMKDKRPRTFAVGAQVGGRQPDHTTNRLLVRRSTFPSQPKRSLSVFQGSPRRESSCAYRRKLPRAGPKPLCGP